LMNGAADPALSPRLAEQEEESSYFGLDEDDDDDEEDDENPLVFPATATVALGAWFAYTRKKRANEERRSRKTKRDSGSSKSKSGPTDAAGKFIKDLKTEVTEITKKTDDGKTPKQRYRERRAAKRAFVEARESELEKARLVRREELSKAAERETRLAAEERAERAKDALAREAERERMMSEARAKVARQEALREAEAKHASEVKAKLSYIYPEEKKKGEAKEVAAKTKEASKVEAAKKAEAKAKTDAATKAKVAEAKTKAEAEAAAEKARIAGERAESNAAAQVAREKAKMQKVVSDAAKAEEVARRKAALEAKAQETAAAAKQKLKAVEAEAKAARVRAAKEKKEMDAAAKAQRDAKVAKEKAKLAEAKPKAAKDASKSAKSKSSGNEKVSPRSFQTTVTEKAAVFASKGKGLRSSLPTPSDARGVVTAAQRKANALAVAVDASPNPQIAAAAAYIGVKPSTLIGGGFALAAVAVFAYASDKGGGPNHKNPEYAAFDRKAGRSDRAGDGGFGRDQQRAYLEKQLAADRDAQRARWRSALEDSSDASTTISGLGAPTRPTRPIPSSGESTTAGARRREMFGLGDAAKKADEESNELETSLAEDERVRLKRIRAMNMQSQDATALAERKLREARFVREGRNTSNDASSSGVSSEEASKSSADRKRAEQKRRAEAAVLSEYQTGPEDGEANGGWDAKEVEQMSKKYKAFLKASKTKKWWSRGD